METYTGMKSCASPASSNVFNRSRVESQVMDCLNSSEKFTGSKFQMRLARRNNKEDAHTIARLVQGLAIYEKEPDAVKCTWSNYLLDGGGEEPIFYCLLLDHHDFNEKGKDKPYTCGMAFIYFGYNLNQGRFLYLEDLFLEEPYRKQGGGSLTLQILAEISLRLECSQFYWTALDWNTPALNLYTKIGARVQPGLRISRYTDSGLNKFANESLS